MKDLMGMIPGVGKAIKDVEISDDAFKHIEAIIYSMTPEEEENLLSSIPREKTELQKVQEEKLKMLTN
jgi:signal recognition particle subunit SRP54